MAIYWISTDWEDRKDEAETCNLWFDNQMAFAGDHEGNRGKHTEIFKKLLINDLILMYHDNRTRHKIMNGFVGIGRVYEQWNKEYYQGE